MLEKLIVEKIDLLQQEEMRILSIRKDGYPIDDKVPLSKLKINIMIENSYISNKDELQLVDKYNASIADEVDVQGVIQKLTDLYIEVYKMD